MYELAGETLQEHGYGQYEISNWARPGRECRHNLQYWRGLPYLAFGAGAHGYAGGMRYSNVLRIKTYIDRMREPGAGGLQYPLSPAAVNQHRQTLLDDRGEYMMTKLRLTREGVSTGEFQDRFGAGLNETYRSEIESLVQRGLLEWQDGRLRLTKRGRLLGNRVFMEFIA
jgi:oxygen-independent coproporphyrinogen-3 oxidase